MNSFLKWLEFVKNKHNNFYDYSLVEYKNQKTKVKIICPIHGVFEMAPEHHLSGQNCPKCSLIDTESFIRRASEKYDNFYDYSKTVFTKIDEKVTITCPIHGDFEVIAGNHLYHNAGC